MHLICFAGFEGLAGHSWSLIHDPWDCEGQHSVGGRFLPCEPELLGETLQSSPCYVQPDGRRHRMQQSSSKYLRYWAISEHLVFYSWWTATRTRNNSNMHSWVEDCVHQSPSPLSSTKPGLGSLVHLARRTWHVWVTQSHRPSQRVTPRYHWICYLSSQLGTLERSLF